MYFLLRQVTDLVGDDALVDGEVLAAQRVDGDVPAEHAHAALLHGLPVAPPPHHAGPLRALRLLRLAVHLHRLAHLPARGSSSLTNVHLSFELDSSL